MSESEGPDPSSPGATSHQGTAVEAAASAGNAFLRPIAKPLNSVVVIDQHLFTRQCIARSLQSLEAQIDVRSFATCGECLGDLTAHDLVLYHMRGEGRHFDRASWLDEVKGALTIAPVVILCSAESPELVREAFENGARGYVPTSSTTLEIAVEIIRLVRAGGSFLPPSFLEMRRPNGAAEPARRLEAGAFTPRQMVVLEQLQLGKANKTIAHALGMSESTVKVHIRNIMKKMKATNRTEVAYRARALFGRA